MFTLPALPLLSGRNAPPLRLCWLPGCSSLGPLLLPGHNEAEQVDLGDDADDDLLRLHLTAVHVYWAGRAQGGVSILPERKMGGAGKM